MFENQLKDTIEYLDRIKYDDFQALYYIGLLNTPVFVGLIKSVLEDDSVQNKEKVLLKAYNNSWRAEDFDYILSIWENKKSDTVIEVSDDEDLADEDDSLSEEELDAFPDETDFFSDVIVAEEKQSEYYFQILHIVTGAVDEISKQQIVIKSNMFDLPSIINTANILLHDCISLERTNTYILDSQKIVDFHGFMFSNIVNPIFFDKTSAKIINCDNEISIQGDADSLDDLSLFLQYYLSPLNDFIEIEKLFHSVRSKIINLDVTAKSIKIDRCFDNAAIVQKCTLAGITTLGDLATTTPYKFSIHEAIAVSDFINKFDIETPDHLITQVLNELRPREKSVIICRYVFKQTLEEVGAKLGLTRERVRQLETKAIRKIGAKPANRIIKKRIAKIVKLYSKNRSFITQEEFSRLCLSDSIGIFLDKILRLFYWDSDLELGFFNEASMKSLFKELEELPPEFTFDELDDYAGLISLELNGDYSTEEVKYIIVTKYKSYGDFIVKGRLVNKVVLSYLLKLYFPEGFDLYDEEKIDFLRAKALEHFDGFELAGNNRAIRARLQDFCIPIGRGVWKLDSDNILIPNDLKERIVRFINDYQAPILPIQAILDTFALELEKLDITNKYHLQGQLKKIISGIYDVNRDYIIKNNSYSIYDLIADYVKKSSTLVTKHDIMKAFPGVTEIVIQQAATNTKVLNMNGYYVHLDNLHISSEEQDTLKKSIDAIVSDTSIYHAKTVFGKVKSENAGLFSRVGVSHYLQFYYLLKELFFDEYAFNRPFIAKIGVDIISGEAQVLEKISAKKEVSIAEVREFAKEVGTFIDRYIEFVDRNNDTIVFKNRNSLILSDEIGLEDADFSSLDTILALFIGEMDYRALNEFFEYWKLPELNIKWNEWLLYSIVGKYSQNYKLTVSSNFLQDAIPVLVKSEFDEKAIDFSIYQNIQTSDDSDEEDLLDVLDYDDLL